MARDLRASLAVFTDRRILVMTALGFSAGMPFFLVFDTLSAWLRDVGLTLEVIGYFSLATLVYSFKFLWAPLVDRANVPLLTAALGHRRSWMLVCQGLVMLGLWLIAGTDPVSNLGLVAALAILTGFAGATQDVVIDAWRIEATGEERQGAMAAAYSWGYRGALITAGALPLVLAERFSWEVSYAAMAALMLAGVAGTLLAPREQQHVRRPMPGGDLPAAPVTEAAEWAVRGAILAVGALLIGSGLAANAEALAGVLSFLGAAAAGDAVLAAWASPAAAWYQIGSVTAGFVVLALATRPVPGLRTRPGLYLSAALGDPIRDFVVRYRGTAVLILALICSYRLSDFVLNIVNPFYLDMGFTLTEVAEVRKIFGVVASVTGLFLGGLAVAQLGLMRAFVIGAFAQPVSNLVFVWLTTRGHDLPSLFVTIGIENIGSGFASVCLIAYMSSLTTAGFTATQYALFSSLYALPGRVLSSQSGRIVEGAARSADTGGVFSAFDGLFASLPAGSFTRAMEQSGVTPAGLASGYAAFFTYSAAIGVLAVVLAFIVAAKQRQTT